MTVSRVTIELKESQRVELASAVAMALPLQKETSPERLTALGSGTHTFAVRGKATFRTPFGKREVPFEQEGAMVFGERSGS